MPEIEEKFYKTFCIKPVTLKDFNYDTLNYNFKTICINEVRYPKINDRLLLELICILSIYTTINYSSTDIDKLRNEILNHCIKFGTTPFWDIKRKNQFKLQVRALFGEGAEDV